MNLAEVRRRQAGAFSEILMMITVFVIGNLIGDNGIVYVAVAAHICALFGALVSEGVVDCLGKLLRRRKNKGLYKNAHRMRLATLVFQMAIGLVGSLLLLALAGVWAEHFLQIKYSGFLIRIFSPILFLRAITNVLLGCCQGEGLELPTAITGVLRQLLVLVFSILFVGKIGDYGSKVGELLMQENFAGMYCGMGVAVSVLVAELLCIVFILVIYRAASTAVKKDRQEGLQSTDSYFDCIRGVFVSRIPYIASKLLILTPILVAVFFLIRNQQESLFYTQMGTFLGRFLVLCVCLMAFVFIQSIPSMGKAFGYIRKEDRRFARAAFGAGVHITIVNGVFCTVFVAVMAPQLSILFGGENVDFLQKLFTVGSAMILLGALCRYFGRFLLAAGKWPPMICAMLVVVFICSVFLGVTMHGEEGKDVLFLLYGCLIGLFLLTILLGVFSFQLMRERPDWLKMLVIPVGAAVACGLLGIPLGNVFTPHLGNAMTTFVVLIITVFLYWVLLLVLRAFREQELEMIAGGKLILHLGQMFKVF